MSRGSSRAENSNSYAATLRDRLQNCGVRRLQLGADGRADAVQPFMGEIEMTEWALLVAFWLGLTPGPGNMNMAVQPGFRSKSRRREAGGSGRDFGVCVPSSGSHVKFSDLVAAGLEQYARAPGPDFADNDPWAMALRGFLKRAPTLIELSKFYHRNELGVAFGTAGEYAVRVLLTHKVKWAQFLSALRSNGL